MKTYMPGEDALVRKWYVIDAEGKTFGRLASRVASILRGKHKPEFTPHADMGDYVIVVNADKLVCKQNTHTIYGTALCSHVIVFAHLRFSRKYCG